MGYYSFYRILKDIIRTIFGSKVWKFTLIILILFTIFFIMGQNGVFATTSPYIITLKDSNSSKTADITLPSFINEQGLNFIFWYSTSDYSYKIYVTDGSFSINGKYLHTTGTKNYYTSGASFDFNNMVYLLKRMTISPADTNSFYIYPYENYDYSTNTTVTNSNGDIVYDNTFIKYPEVVTPVEDLQSLNFDVISINAWDFSKEDLDILFYDLNYGTDTTQSLYPKNVITLNQNTTFFQADLTSDPSKNAIYWIPNTETGLNFVKGGKYGIRIAKRNYGVPRWWRF